MKTIGIIAEYNPFHNGHEYQIKKIREIYPECRIIVVMSGDFVQRGEPAIIDKWKRSKMALLGGVDMVLELPVKYATASAKDFAFGGVSLLNSLQIVDEIAFGCEDDNIDAFNDIADFLINPPIQYEENIKKYISDGLSYPKAREKAISRYISNASELISKPNNILALEYIIALKELKSNITPLLILRNGNSYNDTNITDESMCSAMAIRNSINNFPKAIATQMPDYAYSILMENERKSLNTFSRELRYKLLSENDFTKYYDISEDLSNKINKYKKSFTQTSDFLETLKSKNMTYSHISRCMLHILLNITSTCMEDKMPQYARILGLRKSEVLFSDIKKSAKIELISKLADFNTQLSSDALLDIFASELYSGKNEYTRQINIINK